MFDLNATAVAHENDTLTHSDTQDPAMGEITYAVGDEAKSGAPEVSFNGGIDTIGGTIGTSTTVMDIELPFSSALEHVGDIDVVGINTTLDTRFAYQIQVSTTSSVLDLYGLLYSGSGSTISSATASNGQDLVFDLASGQGIEHIAISDSSNNDVGDYTITINNDDTIASTQDGSTPTAAFGTPFTSAIDVNGDVDFIQLGTGLNAQFAYQIVISTTSSVLDLYGQLFSGFGFSLTSGSASNGADLVFDLASGEDFQHISIGDSSNNDIGDYTITINNDDTIGRFVGFGTPVMDIEAAFSSNIDVNGDVDVIEISETLDTRFAYQISITNASNELGLFAVLRDGTTQTQTSASASTGADLVMDLASGLGIQYIQVSDSSNNDIGDYTITINNDDTIASSTASGTALMGIDTSFISNIDVNGDVDVIEIDTVFDTRFAYQIALTNASSELDLYAVLMDGTSAVQTSGSASAGQDLVFDLSSGYGIQYIQVGDSSNNDIGDYTITINNDDTIASAVGSGTALMDIEGAFSSNIDINGDVDIVEINTVLDTRFAYQIALTNASSELDLYAVLMDSTSAVQTSGSASAGQDLVFDLSSGYGIQYIQVGDSSNNDIGDYTISINNDDTIASGIHPSSPVMDIEAAFSSNIDVNGDVDVVKINTTLGALFAYQIAISNQSGELDLYAVLLDGSAAVQTTGSASSGQDLVFNLASGYGIEYISLGDSSNNDIGDYTITINNDDTIASAVDASTTIMSIEAPFTSNIDVQGDVDLVEISQTLDTRFAYGVEVSTTSSDLDLYVTMLDGSNAVQTSASASSGNTASIELISGYGIQYITVGDSSNNDIGDYTITINNDDTIGGSIADTTTTMQAGRCLISAIDVSVDRDFVGIDLVAGETYEFFVTTQTQNFDLYFNLFSPTMGIPWDGFVTDTNQLAFLYTATETGRYYMSFQESGTNSSGDYMILVTEDGDGLLNGDNQGNELHGGGGRDTLNGGAGNDTLVGGVGDDRVIGGNDDDSISGGSGRDTLFGGTGNDTMDGGSEADSIYGNDGADTIRGGGGTDLIFGNDQDDSIQGDGGNDTIIGGTGRDTIYGNGEDDLIRGGGDADRLLGGFGNDTLDGGFGWDAIIGNDGNDHMQGRVGNDRLDGGAGRDLLEGDAGNDTLIGNGGDDTLLGGGDVDRLQGGFGNDYLEGSFGWDVLIGNDGADTLNGGIGNDRLTGGADADVFQFALGDGTDTLVDYQDGTDQIQILSGAAAFGDLALSDSGGNAIIAFGNVSIIVQGTSSAVFDAGDFIF